MPRGPVAVRTWDRKPWRVRRLESDPASSRDDRDATCTQYFPGVPGVSGAGRATGPEPPEAEATGEDSSAVPSWNVWSVVGGVGSAGGGVAAAPPASSVRDPGERPVEEADAAAVAITRYPPGLASALRKIAAASNIPMRSANNATAHLWLNQPSRVEGEGMGALERLFATHPPIQERIRRLEQM